MVVAAVAVPVWCRAGDFHYRGGRAFLCLARWFVWGKNTKADVNVTTPQK